MIRGRHPVGRRPFLIISEMNGMVLDVSGGQSHPGAPVIMFRRKVEYSPNQLWYLDDMQCIRSCLNEFALECSAQGDKVRLQPFRGEARQQWIFQGRAIVNRMFPGECPDIERAENREQAGIIAWPYKGSANQHWRVDYV